MTVTNFRYLDEITGGLIEAGIEFKHVCLIASKKTLKKRLKKRGEKKNSWGEQQIDRCINSLSNDDFSEHVLTDDRSLDMVVNEVASICGIDLIADNRSVFRKKIDRLIVWKKHMTRIFS